MNNPFNTEYLILLRRQVEEEINFMVKLEHDCNTITTPCMFCIPKSTGDYRCLRPNELRRFLSTIVSNIATQSRKSTERQPIGFASEITYNADVFIRQPDQTPIFSIKF